MEYANTHSSKIVSSVDRVFSELLYMAKLLLLIYFDKDVISGFNFFIVCMVTGKEREESLGTRRNRTL